MGNRGQSARNKPRDHRRSPPRDGGCELTLTHDMDRKWADYAARTEQGWRTMLEALALVESVGSVGSGGRVGRGRGGRRSDFE